MTGRIAPAAKRRFAAIVLLLAAFHAEAAPGWIGFGWRLYRTTEAPAKAWIVVVRAHPGSAAERAGLRPHDVITHINGRPVRFRNDSDAVAFFHSVAEKQRVEFSLVRNRKKLVIPMVAGVPPPNHDAVMKKNRELAK